MPTAGLPVDELTATAAHTVHLLLKTTPVPAGIWLGGGVRGQVGGRLGGQVGGHLVSRLFGWLGGWMRGGREVG